MKLSDKYLDKWLARLGRHDISKFDYNKKEKELQIRFGKTPTIPDVIWGLWNNLIVTPCEDLEELACIYYEAGGFLHDEGKDPFQLYQLGLKTKLLYLKNEGWKKVILSSSNCCSECKKLNNKVYKIEDAMEKLPIPHKTCTNKIRKRDVYPYCFCTFVAKP